MAGLYGLARSNDDDLVRCSSNCFGSRELQRMRHIGRVRTDESPHGGRLLGWVSVRVGGNRGLVDAEPAPHRPEGTVGVFREGYRECPAV